MYNTLRHLILPVLNASGPVYIWLACALLIPFALSVEKQDGASQSFLICALITFSVGLLLSIGTRRWKKELTAKHGFLLVTLIWTSVPLFSTIPYLLETPQFTFSQIYFEMMSCLTTTGATIMSGLDTLPVSLNGWRCFLSWIGGMGLIVLSVAILPLLGVGGSQIVKAETSGPLKENRLTPRIADTAKALYLVYLGVSIACAVSYHLAGMTWADAIMHMMTTVSLSGISTHDSSFSYWNSPTIDTVAIIFMLISGFNYSLHFTAWHKRNPLVYFKDAEAKGWIISVTFMGLLSIFILTTHNVYDSFGATVRYALFSVVSTATTTGYANIDYSLWPLGLPIFLTFSSAVCTCAGSTGGGIKMIRLIILYRLLKREVISLLYPKAVVPLVVNKNVISNKIGFAVLIYIIMWIVTYALGAVSLLLLGLPMAEALTCPCSMLANLGPGLGSAGPVGNYASFTDPQLWCCSFLMVSGRLELFTIFALFSKHFWKV